MEKHNGTVILQFDSATTGNVAVGIPITVRKKIGSAPYPIAVLYDEDSTSSLQKLNPFVSGSTGEYSFYAEDGTYVIEYSGKSYEIKLKDKDIAADKWRVSTTVSEISAGDFKVGDRLEVLDRGNSLMVVVSGGTPNGEDILYAGAGKTAVGENQATGCKGGLKSLVKVPYASQSGRSIYDNIGFGRGTYIYDPSADKANHGKIIGDTLYIAPEAIDAWDGTHGGIDALWGGVYVGSGCYLKQKAMFTALDFGADPTGVNEASKHFSWYAKSFAGNGGYGVINMLPGFYKISNTIQNLTQKIGFQGGGSSNTFLQTYLNANDSCILSSAAAAGTNALSAYKGFSIVAQNNRGVGFTIEDSAYVLFEDIYTENLSIHYLMKSVLTSTWLKCISRFGPLGAVGLWAYNSGTSNPNAMTFIGTSFGAHNGIGLRFDNPANINFIGGSIEACGSGGNAAVVINDAGGQGAAAMRFSTYFEGNGGVADVWIKQSSTGDEFTADFSTSSFNRIDNKFSTNNIRLTQAAGSNLAIIKVSSCAFQRFGTYTPDVARKNVFIDSQSNNYRFVDDGSNYYCSDLEMPEVSSPPLIWGTSVTVDMAKYLGGTPAEILVTSDISPVIQNPTGGPVGSVLEIQIRNTFGTISQNVLFGVNYATAGVLPVPPFGSTTTVRFRNSKYGKWLEESRATVPH